MGYNLAHKGIEFGRLHVETLDTCDEMAAENDEKSRALYVRHMCPLVGLRKANFIGNDEAV